MKRLILGLVVAAVIAVAVVVALNGKSPSNASPAVSHTIKATTQNMAELKAAFIKSKLHYKEMLATDRITWGRVVDRGPVVPLIAYDAVDHRDWAVGAFSLILPASFKAEVSFQDGGNMGIFNKIGSGPWFMTGSPGFPLCARDVPAVVARLWGLKSYPACE